MIRGFAHTGLRDIPRGRLGFGAVLASLAALFTWAAVPGRWKQRLGLAAPDCEASRGSDPPIASWILLLGLAGAVLLWNTAHFSSPESMPDASSHLEYIQLIRDTGRVPLAEDGWQMYHPPLFYAAVAGLDALLPGNRDDAGVARIAQTLNSLFGLLTLAGTAWFVRRLLPGRASEQLLGFSVAAFLPVGFGMYAHITNEVLAASLIALVIVAASGGLFDRELRPRTAPKSLRIPAVLGLVAGLGLLTKFSALFAAAAVGALLGLRALDSAPAERRRSAARALLSFASVVLFVAGWFYARNALQYGNPVIGNWDVESGYAYTQQPGYRTSGFFLQFGAALWHLPERALYSSLWDGLYATAWCDAQAYFLPGGPRAVEPLASAILWLALIPSAAVLLGFLRAAAVLIRGNLDHPFFVPVLTTLWMLSAVVLFALELPFFSTVNAAFLLGLLPAIALFAGLGFEALFASWPRLRGLVLVDLAGLYALILWVFRAEVPTPL